MEKVAFTKVGRRSRCGSVFALDPIALSTSWIPSMVSGFVFCVDIMRKSEETVLLNSQSHRHDPSRHYCYF